MTNGIAAEMHKLRERFRQNDLTAVDDALNLYMVSFESVARGLHSRLNPNVKISHSVREIRDRLFSRTKELLLLQQELNFFAAFDEANRELKLALKQGKLRSRSHTYPQKRVGNIAKQTSMPVANEPSKRQNHLEIVKSTIAKLLEELRNKSTQEKIAILFPGKSEETVDSALEFLSTTDQIIFTEVVGLKEDAETKSYEQVADEIRISVTTIRRSFRRSYLELVDYLNLDSLSPEEQQNLNLDL
jgi:hypothetical protein